MIQKILINCTVLCLGLTCLDCNDKESAQDCIDTGGTTECTIGVSTEINQFNCYQTYSRIRT